MTGVQTCALPICFPVTIKSGSYYKDEVDETTDKHGKWLYYDRLGVLEEERNYYKEMLHGKVVFNGFLSNEGKTRNLMKLIAFIILIKNEKFHISSGGDNNSARLVQIPRNIYKDKFNVYTYNFSNNFCRETKSSNTGYVKYEGDGPFNKYPDVFKW